MSDDVEIPKSYRVPESQGETARSLLFGVGFTVAVFVLMALAQMLGVVNLPDTAVDESGFAYQAPEVEQVEEEPPPEEEEPEELEEEPPPEISLEMLDLALNPGAGSLAGDFALPSFQASKDDLGTDDFVDFSNLDQAPRILGSCFNFPRRLLKEPANGKLVLLVSLSEAGTVLDAEVEFSNLPRFDDVVVSQLRGCKFSPPTQQGKPVRAMARLPIPIRIN